MSKNETFNKNATNADSSSKKSKKLLITLVSVGIAILLGVSGWFVFGYLAEEDTTTSAINTTTEDAKKIVSEFLNAYRAKDGEVGDFLMVTSVSDTSFSYNGYQKLCAEKLDYRIIDAAKSISDTETVLVSVEVENYDLETILNMVEKKALTTDDEILEYFYSIVESINAPTKTYYCNIKCRKFPSGIKIMLDAELSNALLGGYSAYISSVGE